jgi:Bacteriophage HK97-gp10, putative tail-component
MARIVFPSTLTAQLDAYGQRLQAEAQFAADKASQFLLDRVQARARLDPEWSTLADSIEVWSQDGQLVVGIRDNDMVSQAFGIEYGDEVRPPTPLFRTLSGEMRQASEVVDTHMRNAFGYGRLTGD